MDSNERLARIGEWAAEEIADGSIVGLGTGSTAEAMIRALGARVEAGLSVTGVATSNRTIALAQNLDIPLKALDDVERLDLCIDGADEIDPHVNVVKGKGGALLFEKLVARQADRYLIIASDEKRVSRLGTRLPLPVEVMPLGWKATSRAIARFDLNPILRTNDDGSTYITDGGHWILDCDSPAEGIVDPAGLATALKAITGVVEHGLFIGMVDLALTIDESGAITETVRDRA